MQRRESGGEDVSRQGLFNNRSPVPPILEEKRGRGGEKTDLSEDSHEFYFKDQEGEIRVSPPPGLKTICSLTRARITKKAWILISPPGLRLRISLRISS